MATLPRDGNGTPIPVGKLGTVTTRAFTGTSAATSAFTKTQVVRLGADQDCYFAIGTAPTATTSSIFLPAGGVDYTVLDNGDKVAAIQASVAGTLTIVEIE